MITIERFNELLDIAKGLNANITFGLDELQNIADMLNDLQWYRSHDLIEKKVAIAIVHSIPSTNRIPTVVAKAKIVYTIEKMTNAHPPASYQQVNCIQSERNGDCETCRNITLKVDDICIECLNGANHYEPYIPKEDL